MPYRARGKWVMVQRGIRWARFKEHSSERQAKKHAAALNLNVAAKEDK